MAARMRGLNAWIAEYCEKEQRLPIDVSLLYRMLTEGHVQRMPPRDKILCPDDPQHIREMRVAMRRLSELERNCVWLRFSYPMKQNGALYERKEMASFLGISLGVFKNSLHSGKCELRKQLGLLT